MMKSGIFGTAVVLSLVAGLALLSTGAFAQSDGQSAARGNISVSAHVAMTKSIVQTTASAILENTVQRPDNVVGNCGNWGWGNNCQRFNRCGFGHSCFHPRSNFHCTSLRECRTIQVCHWSRWGRVCQGIKTCRFRSICRRCFSSGWNGGINAWNVKR